MRSTEQPHRILHVLYSLSTGGIETWLLQVLRHIDRDRFQMDFLVHNLQANSCADEIRSLGSQIILCPHPRKYLWQPWQYNSIFKKLLREHGPYDIVHSHTAHFNGYILRLAQEEDIPFRIAHSHNDSTFIDARESLHKRLYITWMKSRIPQSATLGLAASRQAGKYLFGSNGKNNLSWQVCYCSVDIAPFRELVNAAAIRRELNIPADAFVIGHVGRLVEQKNPLFLIEIAAEVAKQEPKMRLLLVGDGSLRPELEAKVNQVGLGDRVIFAGIRSDVPRLMLGAMDIFLFPSLYEGLGLALIEAQAAGLPCVLSDVVPDEADVIQPLMQRMSLLQPVSIWAQAILRARNQKLAIAQADALAGITSSPFNIEIGVKKIAEIYESKAAN